MKHKTVNNLILSHTYKYSDTYAHTHTHTHIYIYMYIHGFCLFPDVEKYQGLFK